MITESRLEELRRNAVPIKPDGGYYGMPLLKEPVWTWEVPAYFFVGGAAGAAAVVGAAAQVAGADRDLVSDARWIAGAGALLSGPLLVADLGRPERFLNMLRVFKVKSPMSVGAWTLTAFGTFASAALFADEMRKRTRLPVELIGDASAILSAATGLVMATYTGVLIGATAIPVWSQHVSLLPIHFGASALASAVSMLELAGHNEQALNVLGLAAAALETYFGYRIETDRAEASDPLRRGATGITTRIGGFFSGPLPLLLRMARFRKAAAASSLLGSLITRMAWVEAGKASSRDLRVPLALDGRHASGPRDQIGE
ncbi:MAG TPA: NrfD/PsrC family molybdoenzyme membrane anchor subunit [Thermoanaerobaculia bacterium]|nr:NrfD/PsrC family molybdoenzyme membrane anchor subunit [Thermoanaerobaculia bacterium]